MHQLSKPRPRLLCLLGSGPDCSNIHFPSPLPLGLNPRSRLKGRPSSLLTPVKFRGGLRDHDRDQCVDHRIRHYPECTGSFLLKMEKKITLEIATVTLCTGDVIFSASLLASTGECIYSGSNNSRQNKSARLIVLLRTGVILYKSTTGFLMG